MPKFRVDVDGHTVQTRRGSDSGLPFSDRGETYTSNEIRGIQRVGDREHFDVICNKEASVYYLLYVVYETGDSFGRDGGRIEFVDLYADEEIAARNARRIRENEDEDQQHSIQLEDDNGDFFTQHCPWVGYFERLEEIVVKPVMTGGGSF